MKTEDGDSGQDLSVKDVYDAGKLYGRDAARVIEGIQQGATMPAAIMLELPNGKLHNVAGNTRLMACRALGVTPKVWWVSSGHDAS